MVANASILHLKCFAGKNYKMADEKETASSIDPAPETSLLDLTPEKFRCSWGGCPAVFDTINGELLIIGKKPSASLAKEIEGKVGEDEWAIVIDRQLLSNITEK